MCNPDDDLTPKYKSKLLRELTTFKDDVNSEERKMIMAHIDTVLLRFQKEGYPERHEVFQQFKEFIYQTFSTNQVELNLDSYPTIEVAMIDEIYGALSLKPRVSMCAIS